GANRSPSYAYGRYEVEGAAGACLLDATGGALLSFLLAYRVSCRVRSRKVSYELTFHQPAARARFTPSPRIRMAPEGEEEWFPGSLGAELSSCGPCAALRDSATAHGAVLVTAVTTALRCYRTLMEGRA